MNFLPDNYKAPSSSNKYMKLQDGENRIRILSKPILGWEEWADEKPIRYKEQPAKNIDITKPARHFWAFIVFDYASESIRILQISQAKVRNAIQNYCNDNDWGSPFEYDLKITRSGKELKTDYAVVPGKIKPVDQYIVDLFEETPINLDAMFVNGDPFAPGQTYTPCAVQNLARAAIKPVAYQNIATSISGQQRLSNEESDPFNDQVPSDLPF